MDHKQVTIIKSIGSGGSSDVFEAKILSQTVALKTFKKNNEAKFRNELKALIKFHSTYIIKLIGYCEDPEQQIYWIILPFYKENLENLIVSPLHSTKALQLAAELAEGLSYVHKLGYLHRDLKPENILLTDETGTSLVIADLDTVREAATCKTRSGTVPYMAPEYLSSENPPSSACDIWSFGTVLYQMLTGLHPYNGIPNDKVEDYIRKCILPGDLKLLPQDLHSSIPEIITECWDIDPSKRPTATDLASRLKQFMADEEKDKMNINVIMKYLNYRVRTSETKYRFHFNKNVKGKQFSKFQRLQLMLKHAEQDIQCWTPKQRKLIANAIETKSFVTAFDDLHKLQHDDMDATTDKCIYLWRNSNTRKGYIGKTSGSRSKRDSSHEKGNQLFDKELQKDRKSWDCITVCQYEDEDQCERLECLHIIVFNTSYMMSNFMGYNVLIG